MSPLLSIRCSLPSHKHTVQDESSDTESDEEKVILKISVTIIASFFKACICTRMCAHSCTTSPAGVCTIRPIHPLNGMFYSVQVVYVHTSQYYLYVYIVRTLLLTHMPCS